MIERNKNMNNLEKIRAKHGLTQTALGDKLGRTRAAVSILEKRTLSVKNAEMIASVLHENVFDVLGLDVLKKIPTNRADKERLLNIINSIEVK